MDSITHGLDSGTEWIGSVLLAVLAPRPLQGSGQSLEEVWRIDIYLIDQKSIEIFPIDISPIVKSIVEVFR
jgi:hypothetical protein